MVVEEYSFVNNDYLYLSSIITVSVDFSLYIRFSHKIIGLLNQEIL